MYSPATTLTHTSLFTKVAMLLTGSMAVGALGSFLGAGITSLGAIIVLALLFIGGAIAVKLLENQDVVIAIPALFIWVFISGLFIGPTLHLYNQLLGWQTVFLAYLGTAGVMAVCGAFGALSGRNFTNMGRFLTIGLFGLIIVGVIACFVSLGSVGIMIYSVIGMLIFAGFFIFDFFRLSQSAKSNDHSWGNAIDLTIDLYLDFINFFLYLLQFIAAAKGDKSSRK
jgi:FtsH-binding integral membrane protein